MAQHYGNCEDCGAPIFGAIASHHETAELVDSVERSCPSSCPHGPGSLLPEEDED